MPRLRQANMAGAQTAGMRCVCFTGEVGRETAWGGWVKGRQRKQDENWIVKGVCQNLYFLFRLWRPTKKILIGCEGIIQEFLFPLEIH